MLSSFGRLLISARLRLCPLARLPARATSLLVRLSPFLRLSEQPAEYAESPFPPPLSVSDSGHLSVSANSQYTATALFPPAADWDGSWRISQACGLVWEPCPGLLQSVHISCGADISLCRARRSERSGWTAGLLRSERLSLCEESGSLDTSVRRYESRSHLVFCPSF